MIFRDESRKKGSVPFSQDESRKKGSVPFSHSGLIDVKKSVAGMTNVIEHVNDYEAGQFVAFDGKIVPY